MIGGFLWIKVYGSKFDVQINCGQISENSKVYKALERQIRPYWVFVHSNLAGNEKIY